MPTAVISQAWAGSQWVRIDTPYDETLVQQLRNLPKGDREWNWRGDDKYWEVRLKHLGEVRAWVEAAAAANDWTVNDRVSGEMLSGIEVLRAAHDRLFEAVAVLFGEKAARGLAGGLGLEALPDDEVAERVGGIVESYLEHQEPLQLAADVLALVHEARGYEPHN